MPAAVVAADVVEVPTRFCVKILTVLTPEDTSRPVSCKTAHTVQVCDRSAAEAAVDVDVTDVVVADAVVEVPTRSCIDILTVQPPEDNSCHKICKTARMVQARDHQISKEKAKWLIVEKKLSKSNAATILANLATKKAKYQLCAVKASQKLAADSADKGKKKVKNEKTDRITAERRAQLHVESAANANHNIMS